MGSTSLFGECSPVCWKLRVILWRSDRYVCTHLQHFRAPWFQRSLGEREVAIFQCPNSSRCHDFLPRIKHPKSKGQPPSSLDKCVCPCGLISFGPSKFVIKKQSPHFTLANFKKPPRQNQRVRFRCSELRYRICLPSSTWENQQIPATFVAGYSFYVLHCPTPAATL